MTNKMLATTATLLFAGCGEMPVNLPQADVCDAWEVIESIPGRWEGERAVISIKSVDHGTKVEEFLGEPKEWRGVVADLEVCARSEVLVLQGNFKICEEREMVWDEAVGPQKVYGQVVPMDVQFREPVFRDWDEIPAGECSSGPLTFVETWAGGEEDAPRPVAIVYEAIAEDGDVERVAWRLDTGYDGRSAE